MRERILVVEDRPGTLDLLAALLEKEGFDVVRAQNGEKALKILSSDFPDLILLDVMLSGIHGFDICKLIKSDPLKQQIPVIMCLPKDDSPDGRAQDRLAPEVFITKPFANVDLVSQIKAQLKIKSLEERLMLVNRELQQIRRAHVAQAGALEKAYLDTIHCLLAAAEAKDPYICGHAYKVSAIARMMGERMGFDQKSLANLDYASLLHDVGKIGIPLNILSKKGLLERDEMEIIKKHPEVSAEILAPVGFLERVIPIIRHHHENVDGTGYPDGITGEQIPLESRVLAVADAFDAMVSERPYRPPIEQRRAMEVLRERAGSQFDAEVVGVFLQISKEGLLAPLYPDKGQKERAFPAAHDQQNEFLLQGERQE